MARPAAFLLACLLAVGCASLPELAAPRRNLHEPPRVIAPHGELPPGRRDALLARQDKPGKPTLLGRHLIALHEITHTPLTSGNSARLLVDGPASYAAMFRAIRAARDHVNVETYILQGDELGEKLAALLLEKESQGVQVNLLYDAVGSRETPGAFIERMRAGGVNVCAFNPLLPSRGRIGDPNQRDHRKQLIVDGLTAISGGINISSVYSNGSGIGGDTKKREDSVERGWRDTNIEVRGPAVAEFQKLFVASWEKQSCDPLAQRDYFPAPAGQGDKVVAVIGSSADAHPGAVYLTLLSAIREARQSVYITMAYFAPDEAIAQALADAARRGVDVALILPGFTDSWFVLDAGRSYYGDLLAAGVRIYELHGALLHAKTAVIDGVWSTVGSSNFDRRSFVMNDELNTLVLGEDFATATSALFELDRRDAVQIDRARWAERGIGARVKQHFARLIDFLL